MHANRSSTIRAALAAGLLVITSAALALAGPIHMRPYFDADKSEVILVWDEATGQSRSWYYDKAEQKFTPSGDKFQLPKNPGITKNVMMAPYLGPDGSEVVLVWDKLGGKSVSWYYDKAEEKFVAAEAKYQLPVQKGKEIHLAPYLDKDGNEVILAWDAATGKSQSLYFSKADDKFMPSAAGYQLPADLGLKPPVMLRPYLTKDGDETIQAWSVANGQSVNWYYSGADEKYMRSEAGYQLPANPGVSKDVWMAPYLDKDGSEVVLVWSASTGQSVSWYYDGAEKKFQRSGIEFQLPTNPIKAKRMMIMPYLDTDAAEVMLVYDAKTGASRCLYYNSAEKKVEPAAAGFQLPVNPLK
ncbi:MAG TPA: hypothetical protein PK668_10285 [Myxococcota bacterium]|nr:hypothetical protein [Myxococcota bacterium]HRY93445.1 hypothetical protein [Myxococcota bacterium]HSA22118.1 hypothetical protein [Myxococcota bacterium]